MKFQKGDGVKVVADEKRLDKIGVGGENVGKFGKIKRISESFELSCRVEFVDMCSLWFAEQDLELVEQNNKSEIRTFSSGATRDTVDGKLNYRKALSPIVLQRYVQYLAAHRKQSDGSMRDFDNWKQGIPIEAYFEGLGRHDMAVWLLHDGFLAEDNHGPVTLEDTLCAIIFNATGWLHELLKTDVRPFVVPEGWKIEFVRVFDSNDCGWCVKTDMNEYLHKDNRLHRRTTGWENHNFGEAPGYWPTEEAAKDALKQYLEKENNDVAR